MRREELIAKELTDNNSLLSQADALKIACEIRRNEILEVALCLNKVGNDTPTAFEKIAEAIKEAADK